MHFRKPAHARILLTVLAVLAAVLASLAGTQTAARAVATASPVARADTAAAAGNAGILPGIGTRALVRVTATSRDQVTATVRVLAAQNATRLARERAAPMTYTVRAGNSLSSIAQATCAQQKMWTGLYAANRGTIGPNPNMIHPGQVLTISCKYVPGSLGLADPAPASPGTGSTGSHDPPGKVWGVTYGYPNYCGDGDGDGWDVSCSARQSAPAAQPGYQVVSSSRSYASSSYSGGGGMQSCIIARESGGSSQVMNSTGHYGLYQFSASTWAAHGGNPADFGHASVAEQNQVYYATVASDGYSDWAPYDGC